MKIIDARPVESIKPVVRIAHLGHGDLFYRKNYPETIWMVVNENKAVDLKEGLIYAVEDDEDEIVKKVKGHLVVEEIEE